MAAWSLWACVLFAVVIGLAVHQISARLGRPLRSPGYMARRLWLAFVAFCLFLLFDDEGWVVAVIAAPLLGLVYVWFYGRSARP